MNMKNYKNALDKVRASENFKAQTAEMLINATAKKRRFRFAPAAAIAACLALVIALGAFFAPNLGAKNALVITANAAEISENGYTVIANLPASNSLVNLEKNETGGIIDVFHTDFNVEVKGDNIRSLTYSMKNGAFLVTRDYFARLDEYKMSGNTDNISTHEKIALNKFTAEYGSQPSKEINNEIAFTLRNVGKDSSLVKWLYSLNKNYKSLEEFENSADGKEKAQLLDNVEKLYNSVLADSDIKITAELNNKTRIEKKLALCAQARVESSEANGKEIRFIVVDLKAKLA